MVTPASFRENHNVPSTVMIWTLKYRQILDIVIFMSWSPMSQYFWSENTFKQSFAETMFFFPAYHDTVWYHIWIPLYLRSWFWMSQWFDIIIFWYISMIWYHDALCIAIHRFYACDATLIAFLHCDMMILRLCLHTSPETWKMSRLKVMHLI